jgi:hypothetical protein
MKKIFTLLSVMLLSLSSWAVGETFLITFNGANAEFKNGTEVEAGTYFTWNSAKHNFNAKFTGCTWNDIEFTKGLKMEGATLVQFESTAEATVTIVQSNWSTNTIKFDDEELAIASAETITGGYVHTLTGVTAGTHKIQRGSGENGIFAVQVVYTGEAKVKLTAPEITADAATGQVTIGAVANAKEIRYTIDGSDPTEENGEVYAAPFTVEDGVIVKAVAIGEGNYVTSSVAEVQVLISSTVPVAPVISEQAGAIAISCTTPAATIEYSIDGGAYKTYVRSFFITKDCKVSARAKRGDNVSEVAEFDGKAVPQPNDVTTIVMNGDDFTFDGVTATGSGDSQGITLTIGAEGKTWAKADEIEVPGLGGIASLRSSNGATTTVTLPEGQKAVRVTLYSYINANIIGARTCGWREVNGVSYSAAEAPMGAFKTGVADYLQNPDIRSYLIDGKNEFTFTNTGEQLCFVIAVDLAGESTVIPTAISEVKAADMENAVIFNLAGQKVNKSYKGVVIKNGKKMIQK